MFVASVVTSAPPGASTSNPSVCVSASPIASYTSSTGTPAVSFAISAASAAGARERSSTCVAPRDLSSAALCGDAVARMGENLERRATWMAVCVVSVHMHGRERGTGERRGGRTVLPDGGRAAEDDGGLADVLGLAALLPGRSERDGFGVRVVAPEAGGDGRESERNRCGLVESDVLRDLHGGSIGIPDWKQTYLEVDRKRTLAARSKGTRVYCWKVAWLLVK